MVSGLLPGVVKLHLERTFALCIRAILKKLRIIGAKYAQRSQGDGHDSKTNDKSTIISAWGEFKYVHYPIRNPANLSQAPVFANQMIQTLEIASKVYPIVNTRSNDLISSQLIIRKRAPTNRVEK